MFIFDQMGGHLGCDNRKILRGQTGGLASCSIAWLGVGHPWHLGQMPTVALGGLTAEVAS